MRTRGPWTTTLPDLVVLYRTHTMPPKPNQTTRAHSSSTYTPPSLSSAAGVCMGHKPLPALPHWLSSPSHRVHRLTCTCSVTSSRTAATLPPAYVCLAVSPISLRETPSVLCSVPYFLISGTSSPLRSCFFVYSRRRRLGYLSCSLLRRLACAPAIFRRGTHTNQAIA